MTSGDVKEALLRRWPPDQFLSIYEAPEQSDPSGTKLDLVVVSLWKSRGLTCDGVEIKVSMSDWKRELDNPAKADWWHAHVARFWIAAPADVAKKIKPQLPPNWGLLSCTADGVRALVHPDVNRERVPFSWSTTVGLLRAAADCGLGVLQREYGRGLTDGARQAEAQIDRSSSPAGVDKRIERLQAELDRERERIAAFERASGLRLDPYVHGAGRMGALVGLVSAAILQGPDIILDRLDRQIEQVHSVADVTAKVRDGLAAAFAAPEGT